MTRQELHTCDVCGTEFKVPEECADISNIFDYLFEKLAREETQK